jgi:hypothetical protein
LKPKAWYRGDIVDHFGELALVITNPTRFQTVEIEVFATGARARAMAIHLRRPRKAQLLSARARLLALAKRSKNYAAHVGIELDLRVRRAP